ncbi:VanZ family protein [Corallincola platygyrae]|uniref:VanZ family protein n=1 Tax=Corallincola platygyrae TaxID=1193278 RepID=A0ABW4XLP9_9GAMM
MQAIVNLLKNRWLYLATLIVCVIVISVLAFTDPPKQASLGNDKYNHFLAFFVLAFLCSHGLLLKLRYKLVLLGCYGLLIEWVQSHLPHRTASILDFAADMAGALTYFALAWLITLLANWFKLRRTTDAP